MSKQLLFWNIGCKQVVADFDGGDIVSDAGLLPMRNLDRELAPSPGDCRIPAIHC